MSNDSSQPSALRSVVRGYARGAAIAIVVVILLSGVTEKPPLGLLYGAIVALGSMFATVGNPQKPILHQIAEGPEARYRHPMFRLGWLGSLVWIAVLAFGSFFLAGIVVAFYNLLGL